MQKRSKLVGRPDGSMKRLELPSWYGRLKVNGRWKWFKLFTDRRPSQPRWSEIIRAQELRASGVVTPLMEQANRPLAEHFAEYRADLKRRTSTDHHRITENMLSRLVNGAGWKALTEIDEASTQKVLTTLRAENDYTVAHVNQFVKKMKAFLHWCVPDRLPFNPLRKLKKGNERKALKRPLAPHEVLKLLGGASDRRRLIYAIAIYAGLRRIEASKLTWADIKLDAVIPHVQLRAETTKTGQAATLPLHPYLVGQLRGTMPGALVFDGIPDKRTIKKDLLAAKIDPADAHGRRAGHHGLRYTFASLLDETGCSHGTRRALMRHGTGDVTDGYTVARLSEMYEAVKRLPSPLDSEAAHEVKTGTDGGPVVEAKQVVTQWTRPVLGPASTDKDVTVTFNGANARNHQKNQAIGADGQRPAAIRLPEGAILDILAETGSRSSIG